MVADATALHRSGHLSARLRPPPESSKASQVARSSENPPERSEASPVAPVEDTGTWFRPCEVGGSDYVAADRALREISGKVLQLANDGDPAPITREIQELSRKVSFALDCSQAQPPAPLPKDERVREAIRRALSHASTRGRD